MLKATVPAQSYSIFEELAMPQLLSMLTSCLNNLGSQNILNTSAHGELVTD